MRTMTSAAVMLALGLGGCSSGPVGLLEEASSAASQTLCTAVFASGRSADDSFDLELRPEPGMGAVAWAMHYEVDRTQRAVRTTISGGFASRAVFAEGRGCTLAYEGFAIAALKLVATTTAELPEIAGSDVVATRDPMLRKAIDEAFAETAGAAPRNTAAVVIVKDGRVVGERYSDGAGVDTPLLTHSIAKSVVNALIGILVRQGKIDVHAPADVPEWQSDARKRITVEQLMRMNAGFGFDEGGGPSVASHIWFTKPDTAAASAEAQPSAPPGTEWGYSSRSYVLLSRIIGRAIGGRPQGVAEFAERELFGPLGMRGVTLEFDAAGTMMGAHAMLGTPRDWAKLGLLYLNDGVVSGRRILPEGWVAWSTTPTPGTGYGAGFWLNNTHDTIAAWDMPWGLGGVPADAYMARGYLGQYVVVVPSEKLVVVRFGYSHAPGADRDGVARLVRDAITALHARTAAKP